MNLVVPDSELVSTVTNLARSILQHSPLGLKTIKTLLRDSGRMGPENAVHAEIGAFAGYARSADFAEGLAAFIEKCKPTFEGSLRSACGRDDEEIAPTREIDNR